MPSYYPMLQNRKEWEIDKIEKIENGKLGNEGDKIEKRQTWKLEWEIGK